MERLKSELQKLETMLQQAEVQDTEMKSEIAVARRYGICDLAASLLHTLFCILQP